MDTATLEKATALYRDVIAPLVLGGPIRPLRPLGPKHCRALAESPPTMLGDATASLVEIARVRHARQLCPVDYLEPVGSAEWLMAGALNDLLQSVNPHLVSLVAPGRANALLRMVDQTLDMVPAAATVGEALCRHATFSRVLQVERLDTTVSWWCGSATFRGSEPPARLFTWEQLRRVTRSEKSVPFHAMSEGTRGDSEHFCALVRRILSLTPLTDLWTAARDRPVFEWTAATLGLLATAPSRVLSLRALRGNHSRSVVAALRSASEHPKLQANTAARTVVDSAIEEVTAFL